MISIKYPIHLPPSPRKESAAPKNAPYDPWKNQHTQWYLVPSERDASHQAIQLISINQKEEREKEDSVSKSRED
jgi:hypothetical protein